MLHPENSILSCYNNFSFFIIFISGSSFRSGSSFVGELLTAPTSTAYFYEPLHAISTSVMDWTADKVDTVEKFLKEVYVCGTEVQSNHRIARKGFAKCEQTGLRVIKTIRAHRETLLPWVIQSGIKVKRNANYNIPGIASLCHNLVIGINTVLFQHRSSLINNKCVLQIVHLVRDPRGMFNSMEQKTDTWQDVLQQRKDWCRVMQEDITLEEVMPKDR